MYNVSPFLFEALEDLLNETKKAGASAADAVAAQSTSLSASMRAGKLSDLERSESMEISLRVLVGKQQSSLATSDIKREAFRELAERAVATAKLAPEDPYVGLPEIEECAQSIPGLDLFDSAEPPATALVEKAKIMEEAALANPAITQVEESGASHSISAAAYRATNGFSGAARSSMYHLSVSAIAGKGTTMVRDYDHAMAHHGNDLTDAAIVGQLAAIRAASRLSAKKMPSGKVPVVFSSRIAGSIVRYLLSGINGQSIARRSSFLMDCLGQDIFSPQVSIVEDPHLVRGLRSRPFDGEGMPCEKRALVDKGNLKELLLNLSSARQLNMKSTGSASREGGVPGISASNVYMEKGPLAPEALISDIKRGFLVVETMGFGVNSLTGDFSQGAAGFWIEDGEVAFPVHELTIAGNLKDMFKNLTPANDLQFRTGVDAPTLRIEGMTVAGA
jgi:PmbA protein